jgi:hypothetical protein
MSAAANKEIVRRFFEEAWNQNKVAELGEYISVNSVTHPGTLTWPFGPEAAAQFMKIWRTGSPTINVRSTRRLRKEIRSQPA